MVGGPSPTAPRHRSSVRGLGRAVVVAVFGFGILTAVVLVAVGALLALGFGLTTPGIVVGATGVVVGLVFAVAQGSPV